MLTSVLFWLFVSSIAIQCGYALYFFTRIFNLPRPSANDMPPSRHVSVIICAKNEARNLEQHLPAILAQRYSNESGKPMYEVIVVNDASDDDTEAVLYRLEQQYSHLWHVTIGKEEPRLFKGKKFALGKGVAHARSSWLLLTDADCAPSSENWLGAMVAPLKKGKEIVAGYGAHRFRKGFLNAFVRWETMHTFLQYSTYAMAGMPYMAVGRNLACTKDIFLKAQQSEIWNALPSGDDDLLIRICATETNTEIVADPEAFTFSDTRATWKEWLRQKQRHISTGKFYKKRIQNLLAFYALAHALSWILFFILMYWSDWSILFIIMMMRCAIYWTIWQTTVLKLKDKKLFRWFLFCDIGWMVYNFVLAPYIFWKNKQQWR
ncbi:MAG TPA: glycosyltransferase [Flavipsychrobacter sp.]|nr:glycosyltransferase [Flavipsychrobacter sp.]